MRTLLDAENRFGTTYLDYLDRDADIPVVSTVAFQGDVAVIRRDANPATTAIPATGFPVVRGEAGGNTHALFGAGFFDSDVDGLELGVLTVPDGTHVLLTHPEHGGLLVEPGTYTIRRQREMADEIRMVAD